MTNLIAAIQAAFTENSEHNTNTVYRLFLGHTLCVPVLPESVTESGDFFPLYETVGESFFIPVFSSTEQFERWAGEDQAEFTMITVRGSDMIKGAGDKVYLCLDIGSEHYKEFAPDEVAKLKGILLKLATQRRLQQ